MSKRKSISVWLSGTRGMGILGWWLCASLFPCVIWSQSDTAMQSSFRHLMYLPDEKPFGLTHAEWGIKWIDYILAFDCETFPVYSTTGQGASDHQGGPVFFLVGSVGGRIKRSITISEGKAVFIPVVNYLNHYPCPYPSFKPAPGQSMRAFLLEGAKAWIDLATNLTVEVDGNKLTDLSDYRFTSDLFFLKANPELVCIDVCITTGPQPSIIDGYWVILKPLPRGAHTVYFHAEIPDHGMVIDVLYEITVE